MATPAAPLSRPAPPVVYPQSDDEPMAENTEQFELIVMLKGNLDALLPGAFVAGDLFWYPVEGDNRTRLAPDVMVALGRPKGPRGSYLQWLEDHHPPDVVFEIWTPGNTLRHQLEKLRFYARHGVREFITYDHDRHDLLVFVREGDDLVPVSTEDGWTSPLLGVRFAREAGELAVYDRAGRRFDRLPAVFEARDRAEAQRDAATAERDAATAER
ncbi:MAG: Uma2 family endonuclease, partial [Deltaproteobacteria bacterium]|nr:Uma2 family endonuclease [Deltaproteobacteria bacterium]